VQERTGALQRGLGFLARQERAFKINLAKVSIQNFFVYLTQQYQSIFVIGLGATPLQLGIMNSAGGLVGAAIATPTGWLADRRGIKTVMLLGMFPMVIGALVFSLASDLTAAIAAVVISTVALRMETTTCPMVCGGCLKSSERAMGMQVCDTLSAIPRVVSPIMGAAVVAAFGGMVVSGIRPLYYIQATGFILVLLVVLRVFSNPPRIKETPITGVTAGLQEVFDKGIRVRRWLAYIFLSSIPTFVTPTYLPLYAAEVKRADPYVLGVMASASMIIPLLLSIPAGRWADQAGRKKIIYLTTLIHCSSLLLLIFSIDTTMLLASSILQGFFTLAMVTQAAMSAELVPIRLLGRWYGLLGLLGGVVGVIAPVVAGLLWNSLGAVYVFVMLIGTELAKLAILVGVPETLKPRED
jgi:MFS family permease